MKGSMKKQQYVSLGIGLGLLAGVYWFVIRSPETSEQPVVETSQPVQAEVIPTSDTPDFMAQLVNNPDTLVADLVDVSGGTASGKGYVNRQDGVLYHYVEANLPEPAEGSVYEGWLVQQRPLKFFSTGVLEQQDDAYTLTYTSDTEYEGYNFVVITEETVVDETPEAHVIEGLAE